LLLEKILMKKKNIATSLTLAVMILSLCAVSFADTVRLKDGTTIRGKVVGFKDQQFTVLIGTGSSSGRRSSITLYIEDVESIEFDGPSLTASGNDAPARSEPPYTAPPAPTPTTETRPAPVNPRPTSQPASSQESSPFYKVSVKVRADNTANGWTNTGLVVRRGQKLKIRASGRVSLGGGNYSSPMGSPTISDKGKLMANEATGALIAVIGDDNDEFLLIGHNREFASPRDGVLFLGINEGNLNDNTGVYDVTIEAEATQGAASR
jgi:hypothetical protein